MTYLEKGCKIKIGFYTRETSTADVDAAVIDAFRRMRSSHESIVLVDGAFDVPHHSHEWYLRH